MASDHFLKQKIEHVVLLMLENRSFDHMLGHLANDDAKFPPRGQSFEGLANSNNSSLFKISETDLNGRPYFMPGSDPGEGYYATNWQIFGKQYQHDPPPAGTSPTMDGFGTNWVHTIGWETKSGGSWTPLPGTSKNSIYGMFTPQLLPILSTLAKSYAVFDHWYCSAPTETLPNRAFVHFATSEGQVEDKTAMDHVFKSESIFHRLSSKKKTWAVYGYEMSSQGEKCPAVLTRSMVHDVSGAQYNNNYRTYEKFHQDVQADSLPHYSFLTPSWGTGGNSQHPPNDVAKGEQLILKVFNDLVGNKRAWNKTLLIITYDEHGGCYDHVPPPWGATPPDAASAPAGTLQYTGQEGFGFDRFGVRVPMVMVSPWIQAGTVVNGPNATAGGADGTPFDHTSILATMEEMWDLGPLTARDKAAPHVGQVINLTTLRTDNPLQGVQAPKSKDTDKAESGPGYLDKVGAYRTSRYSNHSHDHEYGDHGHDDRGLPNFKDYDDYWEYVHHHYRRLGWYRD